MRKIFHSSAKLTVNDWNIDKAFGSMDQSAMTKAKNFVSKDWVVEKILNMTLTSLSVSIVGNNSIENINIVGSLQRFYMG